MWDLKIQAVRFSNIFAIFDLYREYVIRLEIYEKWCRPWRIFPSIFHLYLKIGIERIRNKYGVSVKRGFFRPVFISSREEASNKTRNSTHPCPSHFAIILIPNYNQCVSSGFASNVLASFIFSRTCLAHEIKFWLLFHEIKFLLGIVHAHIGAYSKTCTRVAWIYYVRVSASALCVV